VDLVERMHERFLIRRFQRGDSNAFLKLVERYERRLLFYLQRFERDPERALDVLQDIWLTAWKSRRSLRSPDAFVTWIYRIAHGRVVDSIRAEMRRQQIEHDRQAVVEPSGDRPGQTLEIGELIHFALSQISAEHREVLTLRFLEEMTLEQISEAIDCPTGTVKSRLHYAHQAIQAVIKEQEDGRRKLHSFDDS